MKAVLLLAAGTLAGAAPPPPPAPPAAAAAPIVRVAQGLVRGTAAGGVLRFKAIPYAAPPIGARRWRPPAPPASWPGVRDATRFGPVCPQAPVDWAGHDLDSTSEDCLTLNIWTPRAQPAARLPVMLWLHGGGYTAGAGSQSTYEGTALARRGVVIVTINYRLGALGYLAHPALSAEAADHVSGNYGLRDQIAALAWVHANIARFGGDPANITVFGQSAGGGSALLVTTAPAARGLVAKAIFESPSALDLPDGASPAAARAAAEAAGLAFGRRLGASTAAALRALPVRAIVAASVTAPRRVTAPGIDGVLVPGDITARYRQGRDLGVPILLGWNSDEAARFVPRTGAAAFAAQLRARFGPRAATWARLYPAAGADATAAARALLSDTDFGWRSWSVAEARRRPGAAPAWLYQFDNPPPGLDGRRTPGAIHSDELGYVWGNNDPAGRWPAADRAQAERMQRYWVQFARTGDPNAPGLARWPAYRANGAALLFRAGLARPAAPLALDRLRRLDALLPPPR
ncbi:carboxylesterase/lipase family protein [Sphingomonas morindae]|uniref:Carboxylic ester hydrolase n=1 Tax=Sphingomonas morindae TaxID=1541170 RepID=A0ABY4XCY2_9SPHN|nr:carboxylesterase family protein [Sphingomonas morindae]USI74757.1 carboxylesterase family protein [Sphingomonas morindae]